MASQLMMPRRNHPRWAHAHARGRAVLFLCSFLLSAIALLGKPIIVVVLNVPRLFALAPLDFCRRLTRRRTSCTALDEGQRRANSYASVSATMIQSSVVGLDHTQ